MSVNGIPHTANDIREAIRLAERSGEHCYLRTYPGGAAIQIGDARWRRGTLQVYALGSALWIDVRPESIIYYQ